MADPHDTEPGTDWQATAEEFEAELLSLKEGNRRARLAIDLANGVRMLGHAAHQFGSQAAPDGHTAETVGEIEGAARALARAIPKLLESGQ